MKAENNMFAQPIPNMIAVIETKDDGDLKAIVVSCGEDYDSYKALPDALEYDSILYGKTGWNSDVGKAYYTNKAKLAKIVL